MTNLINTLLEFSKSDAGQAVIILAKIAVTAKVLALAIPLVTGAFTALIAKLSMVGKVSLITSQGLVGVKTTALLAAGGVTKTTLALGALKVAMLASGVGAFALVVGGLATAFIKTRNEAKKFQDIINEGSGEEVKESFRENAKLLGELEKKLEKARGNAKRGIQRQIEEAEAQGRMLEGRLQTLESEKLITAEKKKQNEELEKQEELIKKNQDETDKLKEKMMAVGEEIESSIKNNLRDAITGAKSFGEAMTNVLNRIRDKIIDAQLDKLLGGFGEAFGGGEKKGLGGALGGILGGVLGGLFASGGQPPVNKISVVGERGPELFVPRSAGTVIPNNQIGGESVTNNIVVNVDASGTSVEGNDSDANQFGEQLAAAIQAEIINQKRSGGLLN